LLGGREAKMRRRDKWIIIIGVFCGIAPYIYYGYFAMWAMRDLNNMEARRPVLLYQTDHRALLDACRELSRQVATRKLQPGDYQIHGTHDPEARQFPQLILDLDPLRVEIESNGVVNLMMSPVVLYGVCALPEDYEGSLTELYDYRVELIDGLWYYDEDFVKHPEHQKEVEERLKKSKVEDSSGLP
jgi:hypothetical protein